MKHKNRRIRPDRTSNPLPQRKWIDGKPIDPPNPQGQNHAERRKLKARERTIDSFSKATRARYIKDIQDKEHREALKRRLIKSPKKPKVAFISKRSLKKK